MAKAYRVRYKPTGKKMFETDSPVVPGIHGTFKTMELAEDGVRKCHKYFNTRDVPSIGKDNSGRETVLDVTKHERTVVKIWIEEIEAAKGTSSWEPDEPIPEPDDETVEHGEPVGAK